MKPTVFRLTTCGSVKEAQIPLRSRGRGRVGSLLLSLDSAMVAPCIQQRGPQGRLRQGSFPQLVEAGWELACSEYLGFFCSSQSSPAYNGMGS